MTWVMALLVFITPAAAYAVLWATSGSLSEADLRDLEENLSLGRITDEGGFIVYQVGVLISVVMASSLIATEYRWGTLRAVLARIESRSQFLAAKLICLTGFMAVVAFAGIAGALAGSGMVTLAGGLDTNTAAGFVTDLLAAPLRIGFTWIAYTSLAFAVALWSRSTAAGIVVVVVAFYAEVLLTPLFESGGPLPWFPEDALIYRNVLAILDVSAHDRDATLPNVWQSAGVLLAYAIVPASAAFGVFASRDVRGD
jgi:ABC-type transport system involved in multi-copper enzyme maturation permease subunit